MRYVLINHSTFEETFIDTNTNTITFPDGKEVVVNRGYTLKGYIRNLWMGINDVINYGSSCVFHNGPHVLIPLTVKDLEGCKNPKFQGFPKGAVFIENPEKNEISEYSLWAIQS